MTRNPRWTGRLKLTSNVVHLVALLLAIVGLVIADEVETVSLVAILLATVGVLLDALVDIPFPDGDVRNRVIVVGAAILFSIALAITGGLASVFILLPVASIFLAAAAGGIRTSAPVALIAVLGVLIGSWVSGDSIAVEAFVGIPAVYAITAIAFSEVQQALLTESERAEGLVIATSASAGRRERLEATHDLLQDLLKIATSPDVNAVATAHDALRDVGVIVPAIPTRIMKVGEVHLAHRGAIPPEPAGTVIGIARSGVELARLELWTEEFALTPSQRAAIEATVAPVGLALDNDAMVQRLAGMTIQRERVRLARELHDDVAPSIASVGLALDMVLMSESFGPEQERTLEATRTNVTRLVDTIRARVQDLRADRALSITEMAHSLVAEVDAEGPTVIVDIEERTPPRPAIAVEVGSLLAEAFRNCLRHADATVITIAGRVEDQTGSLTVEDNGRGFEVGASAPERFGLIGMRERAALIGATLDVESTPGSGTTVAIAWKERT